VVTEQEVDQLARYNSERGRGLVHTPEWQAKMAGLQQRWDRADQARAGPPPVPPWWWRWWPWRKSWVWWR
jgi:hypothetical protein